MRKHEDVPEVPVHGEGKSMPEKFMNPRLIIDVDGPADITPSRAMSILLSEGLKQESGSEDVVLRADLGALAMLYASHCSPVHVPFGVDLDSLYALERRGFIEHNGNGNRNVHVKLQSL
jgi:hypothetical protein